MERIDVECSKCFGSFSTAASTRTTCPHCKGAVTVRRGEEVPRRAMSPSPRSSKDATVDLGNSGQVLVLLGFGFVWLWGLIRGKAEG